MKTYLSLAIFLIFSISCTTAASQQESGNPQKENKELDRLSTAYFASGCFWCVEAIFEHVEGVTEVISGYAGGHTNNPTYREIGTGRTGHTESVEIYYDPTVVTYETLVKVLYGTQDPTTVGQAPDFGDQYRSAIFYQTDEEKEIAEAFKRSLAGQYDAPIATEISPLKKFYRAEEYHQDYERINPNDSYIRNLSVPRLNRFKKKFPELVKTGH